MPPRPSSPASARMSTGKCLSASHCNACGAMRSFAKSATTSSKDSCSSVSNTISVSYSSLASGCLSTTGQLYSNAVENRRTVRCSSCFVVVCQLVAAQEFRRGMPQYVAHPLIPQTPVMQRCNLMAVAVWDGGEIGAQNNFLSQLGHGVQVSVGQGTKMLVGIIRADHGGIQINVGSTPG